MKLSKKIMVAGLAVVLLGGASASAMTFDAFYGGVTGIPGKGTTWGMYSPSFRRVAVHAKGKNKKVAYAGPRGTAYAVADRAVSGNKSWWHYR